MINIANVQTARAQLLIDQKVWFAQKGDRLFSSETGQMMMFVSCLEVPFKELRDLIQEGLARAGLPAELQCSFPYSALAAEGLASGSEKWIRLAIGWLSFLETTTDLQNAAEGVIGRKLGTQNDRAALTRWLRSAEFDD